jgi:L-arabinonolactonase
MNPIEHIVSAQCKLGEGPLWHPVEQVFYWLDIYQSCLHRYDPQDNHHAVTDLGLLASAMGVRAEGGFVMATKKGFALWDVNQKQFQFLGDADADVEEDARFNDGKTDRQGRFWAGKMSSRPANSLFRLDADLSIHRMESGIITSNGLGWSPDNRVFYFTDSGTKTIYAYDFEAESGAISNRRIFTQVPHEGQEGFPDGLAVDEEGCIWSARWGGWKVVRYTPDGKIEREIPMPVEFPTSCAFGGPDLRDLYITSAWVEVPPDRRAGQPMAGDLFRLKTDVKGFTEPLFQGR